MKPTVSLFFDGESIKLSHTLFICGCVEHLGPMEKVTLVIQHSNFIYKLKDFRIELF